MILREHWKENYIKGPLHVVRTVGEKCFCILLL